MPRDQRIYDYIARAAPFAQPILSHLRDAVHAACPAVEETIKWSMPAFVYKGRPLAHMAAFKAHVTFGFWRGKEMVGETGAERDAMGQFGRIASRDDLPGGDVLEQLIRKAASLTDGGEPPKRAKTQPKSTLATPDDLAGALAANAAAATTFAAFPPGARRDYVDWVVGAKRPETRAKRVAQAVEWLAEGKKRHWKYETC